MVTRDGMLVTSIIIPTLNSGDTLRTCLNALCRCIRSAAIPCEVIVVDNGSVDATTTISQEFGCILLSRPSVRVGELRNQGAQLAKGTVLAFLDSDVIPQNDWIRTGTFAVLKSRPCITGSRYLPRTPAHWIEESMFVPQEPMPRRVKYINAGNLFIRKAVFLSLGGFDGLLIAGEDSEFCARASKRLPIINNPDIQAVHLGNPKSLRQFFRRERWHGCGAFGSFRHNKWDLPLIATATFIGGHLIAVIGVLASIVASSNSLVVVGACIVLSTVFAATIHRQLNYLRIRLIAKQAILYYVFFAGRSVALWDLLIGVLYPRTMRRK